MSLFAQFSEESHSKRRRGPRRDTKAMAKRALIHHFGEEDAMSICTRTNDKATTAVAYVEVEILRQGKNFQLGHQFWHEFYDNFQVDCNPVQAMEYKPPEGDTPIGIAEAFVKCYSENSYIRSHGLAQLRLELSQPRTLSAKTVCGMCELSFGTPTVSYAFIDELMFMICTYIARQ
jgi:hypothetical protein